MMQQLTFLMYLERPDRVDRAARKKRPGKTTKAWTMAEVSVPGSLNDISAAADMIAEETVMHTSASDETLQGSQKVLEADENRAEADGVVDTVAAAERVLDEALETTFV